MTDTALLAVAVAALAGLLAGAAWAASRSRVLRGRLRSPTSAHYMQGLHYLATGQVELAVSELGKVVREDPGAVEVAQVLSHLVREAGQVERAIQLHQGLLARTDLTRAERAHVLASLGTDFRKAGFLDRAAQTYGEALDVDPGNIHALMGQHDGLVLGHLQAEIGREALLLGREEEAETAFKTALSLDRRVFPAHLGLAGLYERKEPKRAAAILEDAIAVAPERAYLAFDALARAYSASGEPERFASLCERLIRQDAQDWRARLALARHLRAQGKTEEALSLLVRAVEANPQALLAHLEVWRTLKATGALGEAESRYVSAAEAAAFYVDPHICTACRYRADDMLWRCPHCHEWNTFVEERLAPAVATR
jgi:lipopolysaccharide biosynthesis regulator YciM